MPQGCQTLISSPAHAYMLALEGCTTSCVNDRWRFDVEKRLQCKLAHYQSNLDQAGLYSLVTVRLLRSGENHVAVNHVIKELAKHLLPDEVQRETAKAIIAGSRSPSTSEYFLPKLMDLASCENFEKLFLDLRVMIAAWLVRSRKAESLPQSVRTLCDDLRQDSIMVDAELQNAFKALTILPPASCQKARSYKRRKIEPEDLSLHHSRILRSTTRLLTGVESDDLATLPQDIAPVYANLSEDDQCSVWSCLKAMAGAKESDVNLTISRLIDLPVLQQTRRPRVLSLLTIGEAVAHTRDEAVLDLTSSVFGQVTLRSLHSSLRELRIAASQTLPSFLREDLPTELRERNRRVALDYLRTLSERDLLSEHETLILAWGHVAIACGEKELNLTLLRLVQYLGHTNVVVCGLAFVELEKLAEAKQQTSEELLKPFWRTIAVSVVQDLYTRPQKAQQLGDFLGLTVNQFLVLTQRKTLPLLILTKRKDILQRVATARANGTTIQDLILQPRTNFAGIIALLLAQPSGDVEESAMETLAEVAPTLRGTDLANLVKMDPVLTACEMLKHAGEEGPSRKSRAYQAFQTFAGIAERKPGQGKTTSRSSRTVATFFESHILGIMAEFSHMIANGQEQQPTIEKLRCLRAISEMVVLAKGHVTVALPQIRACLHSALDQDELRDTAFSTWMTLASTLDDEDIASVMDQTFALIVQYWPVFSPEVQQMTHDSVAALLKTHNSIVRDNVMTTPSLASIPLMSKFAAEIDRQRAHESESNHMVAFVKRLRDESIAVVLQSLQELKPFLESKEEYIHDAAVSEQPDPAISALVRALLDACIKHNEVRADIADLCAECLGIIGCLDPNRVETSRQKRQVMVLSNFDKASEVIDWVAALLEDVLVKAYKSVANARAQGFLAYVLQELLRFCGFNEAANLRPRASQPPSTYQRWMEMPENIRNTLTPFLTSRYVLTSNAPTTPARRAYPIFSSDITHSSWLRSLVYDLMWKATGDNAKMVFPVLARVIRGHDLSIANFMLPYAALNVSLGGTTAEVDSIVTELLAVLRCNPQDGAQVETVKLCSENVFTVLDYMSKWVQEKRKILSETRAIAYRTGQSPSDFDEMRDLAQIDSVERVLASIPADIIAARAVECRSYSRALFHWEQHIRQQRPLIPSAGASQKDETIYHSLQEIYAQIDEPDGLEGISAHLNFLSEAQQATEHCRAGRWTAAQSWYELEVTKDPLNPDLQVNLLECLKATGQYDPLLRYVDSFAKGGFANSEGETIPSYLLPFAAEASWMIEDLQGLAVRVRDITTNHQDHFVVRVGKALVEKVKGNDEAFKNEINVTRSAIYRSMTAANTASLHACHKDLLKLHVLREMEIIALSDHANIRIGLFFPSLEKRVAAMGSYVPDKQFVLGIRRAIMLSREDAFTDLDVGSSWLETARLARKANITTTAYNAVLRASQLGDEATKLEQARLLWRDGHRRQAIQSLESALAANAFATHDVLKTGDTTSDITSNSTDRTQKQNLLSAKAHLLLAKWLDASGQTQVKDMTAKYQFAAKNFQRWEKGHYYLGKHYNKLLEAERALPKAKQTSSLTGGDLIKLVVENMLRSIPFGNKYWHQTIPKVLTLWLELGMETISKQPREDPGLYERRLKSLHIVHRQLTKYFDRIPPYIFYTALPQIISRISHPNPEVWKIMSSVLTKIVSTHPSQALWSLLAVVKATDPVRVARGQEIINRLKDPKNRPKSNSASVDLRMMITHGQRLSDALLQACEAHVEPRSSSASLSRDLGFNHKLAPSTLVVPIESTLTASLPSVSDSEHIRKHHAFAQDKVTIASFSDDVLVLSSLQRPRKLTVRGSDGKQYGLLCKPKDDLRKDQRLMEFNGMINRALKRDPESSKRRLYIKTYGVTPLSEESGTIEWVEGIKPLRDILLALYRRKGITPNYNDLRMQLNEACADRANVSTFTDKILGTFKPTLHEWFTELYPEPDTWFAARLRYARSAAVMSITGHVLGLGDRHGENILLEESTGGVFHVDFNCLFDKGLTFEKPELVPFRLTHNMVDAMGAYGYEGPFRKSSELTLGLLRQNSDTLMTILETFLYDPTTDFIGKKKRTTLGVPETPQEILDSVQAKLKGLLKDETVPLSVEGYVDALIQQATSPFNLASMYIGWCAFL